MRGIMGMFRVRIQVLHQSAAQHLTCYWNPWNYSPIPHLPLSVTFKMPVASPAIIVLAQLDTRYYAAIAGSYEFTLDFKLFKRGDKQVLMNSSSSTVFGRSINAELDLEAGEYVVHVRINRVVVRSKVCGGTPSC